MPAGPPSRILSAVAGVPRHSAQAGRRGRSLGTIDTSLVTNPPPSAVLSTFVQGPTNQSVATTRYDVPMPDGNYNIRLFFVDPFANGPNQRKFDVVLQGQTVLTNFDIFAEAGAIRKAIAKSFSFTASQGTGLHLELNNRLASGFGSIISGIEITKAVASAPASFAANLEFSADNGQNWSTIATNVPMNRFGEGNFNWNATTQTNGNSGRFRVTAVSDGVPSVQHVSQPFLDCQRR